MRGKKYLQILLLVVVPAILNSGPFIQGNEIEIPNAYILPNSYIQFGSAVTLYNQDHLLTQQEFKTFPKYTFGADLKIGLLNWVELGFAFLGTDVWSGFGKIRLLRESGTLPAVAIGIQNISPYKRLSQYGKKSMTYYKIAQNFSMYGVISKDLSYIFPSIPVTLTLGIGTGRFQGERERSEPWHGIFTGLEIRPIRNLKVISDIDGKDWNLGAIYRVTYNWEVMFAWTEIEQTFGVNYVNRNVPTEQQKIQLGFRLTYGPFFGAEIQQRRQREFEIMRSYEEELEEIRRRREEAEEELRRLRRILEQSGG